MTDLQPPSAPPLHPSLKLSMLLCLLLAAGLYMIFESRQDSVPSIAPPKNRNQMTGFPPLEIDEARLQRERRDRSVTAVNDEANRAIEHLHQLIRQANLLQFHTSDQPLDIRPRDLEIQIQFAADEVIPFTGYDGFVAVGEPLFQTCGEALERMLTVIRRGGLSMERATNDPPARFRDYQESCGNALPMLLERSLISEQGQWRYAYAPVIFDLLNRYRFGQIIHTRRHARLQLSPYEYEVLMRWRIEDPDAYTKLDRERYLRQAAPNLPHYDVKLARTLLAIEGLPAERAREVFEELLDEAPNNPTYQRYFQWLNAQASSTGSAH